MKIVNQSAIFIISTLTLMISAKEHNTKGKTERKMNNNLLV